MHGKTNIIKTRRSEPHGPFNVVPKQISIMKKIYFLNFFQQIKFQKTKFCHCQTPGAGLAEPLFLFLWPLPPKLNPTQNKSN